MNVFISVPMNGLTTQQIEDEIEHVCKIADSYFPLGHLEFVTNFETEADDVVDTVKNERIWHLGEALKCLSICDAIMCPNHTNDYPGCKIEKATAMEYGIPIYLYDIKVLDEFRKGIFHDEKEVNE